MSMFDPSTEANPVAGPSSDIFFGNKKNEYASSYDYCMVFPYESGK